MATNNIQQSEVSYTEQNGLDQKRISTDGLDIKAPSSVSSADQQHATFHGLVIPTEEEKKTLRKVAGAMPSSSYVLCAVEFAERASYYGCWQVYKNFIRGGLPKGGNGAGAPDPAFPETTAGALGKGSVTATAMTEVFKFLAYGLCVIFGWMADVKFGRFWMICWGVAVCGVAHVIMIISALPPLLQKNQAMAPFAISLYLLCIGSAMFKPNITPTVMDQSPHKISHVITDPKTGEKVIVDPEESINSVMLWFYLLINIGGAFGIPTSYLAKLVGFWAAYLLPTIIYLLLPPLLWWLDKRLVKQPPGGSDLGNLFRVLGDTLTHGGWKAFGRPGFWNHGLPSVRRAAGSTKEYAYDDEFVNDVRRTFQATGIFCFFPIFYVNGTGLGAAANALSASLRSGGIPNDLLDNLNPIGIIITAPVMNHIIYPYLRRHRIHWGPISRITTGFAMCTIGSIGYGVLQHYVYKTSPCGNRATTCSDEITDGSLTTAPVSIAYYAIPVVIAAIAEVLVNVTAYGIAYSRAPKNMKGVVSSINLFTTAVSALIALACAPAIQDPYLEWAFFGPTIAGAVCTIGFWFTFKHMDKEEMYLNTDFISDHPSDARIADEERDVPISQIAEGKTHSKNVSQDIKN